MAAFFTSGSIPKISTPSGLASKMLFARFLEELAALVRGGTFDCLTMATSPLNSNPIRSRANFRVSRGLYGG